MDSTIEGVFSVGVKEILEDLPCVEIEEFFDEVIANPTEYVKKNENLFENSFESLVSYSIHKGNEKGEYVILFLNACIEDSSAPNDHYFGVYVTGVGKDHGTFSTIEEAVIGFKEVAFQYENKLVYRVYDAKLRNEHQQIRFCVSTIREVTFKEDVKQGKILIEWESMQLVLETEDRNEARKMAHEF